MEVLKGAIDKHVPKIRSRALPEPKIDRETKEMMEEANRITTLLAMNIGFLAKKKRFTSLRELIREVADSKCG